MVDLRGFPEPAAACGAPALLETLEQLSVVAGGVPQPPSGDAGRVPRRPPVRPAIPQVDVPAETKSGLAADAAPAGAARKGCLAIGRRRHAECGRQAVIPLTTQAPGPALRRAGAGRKRAREAVGT